MITDWLLIRRMAREIEDRVHGAKVRDVGLLPDGRIALAMRSRAASLLLVVDAFASPPSVTMESGELAIVIEPGFVRATAAALRDTTLTGVRSRHGDRVLRLDFGSRSRFGVDDEIELYLELVPRFGNLVLVKRGTVIAAAKEFSLAQNPARAVQAGLGYVPPPLPSGRSIVPKLVAQSGADEATILALGEKESAMLEPLYVYRREGVIAQAHVVPLVGFADARMSREPSLLALLGELHADRVGRGERERTALRRSATRKRLDDRERKVRAELAALESKRRLAQGRTELRERGQHIFATLHELPENERDEAKERAEQLFIAYKKLGATLPHVEARENSIRATLAALEELRWETDRAADEDLDDVDLAVAHLERRPKHQHAPVKARKRKRAPLERRTPSGSRILVGRSPIENADLTFRVARPNDLWFHAQGMPGAHVILARDDRSDPLACDIEAAAALAAFYSKGKGNAKVAIDYTLRKHVRKQQNGPPGLVWYTHPQTLLVEPREA